MNLKKTDHLKNQKTSKVAFKKFLKDKIYFIIFLISLILFFMYTSNVYIFIAINIYLYIFIYFLFKDYLLKRDEERYIEDKFKIVKQNLLHINDLIIIIIKDGVIVWANDNSYEKFPNIKTSRDATFLYDNEDEEKEYIKYNNKVYKVMERGDIYVLMEYTNTYRNQTKLTNIQTIIGHFQIDDLTSLKNTMSEVEYLDFISSFEKKLYSIFINNKINVQKIDSDKYFLNFPHHYIKEGMENRFKDLGELIEEFQSQGVIVTFSMGIAFNYTDVERTGQKAREAFELAISRGGGQIVIFDNEERYYYGGGIAGKKAPHRLRARIIGNTLSRLLTTKEVVYLITHKNPDYDAISGVLLFYEYLKKFNNIEVKVLIDSEASIKEYKLENLDIYNDIIYTYVIDKTKKNILISLDTQSREIISHPKILEELEEKIIIDHHQTPKDYFRGNIFSWIEPTASSTTELVMGILMNSNTYVEDEHINTIGIIGILTDTNRLRYRTSYQTLETLMNLVEYGGDIYEAFEVFYLDRKEFDLKQTILSNTEYFNGFSYVYSDTEIDNILLSKIADELLQIKQVRGSIAICKLDGGEYNVKLRTKGNLNAKNIIEPFGGGGHYKQGAAILNENKKDEFIKYLNNMK